MPRGPATFALALFLATCAARPGLASAGGPSDASAQRPTSAPSHLQPARREPIACGAQADRAARALDAVARTGRISLEEAGWLQALVTGGEAVRHADLSVLALAVADEQALAIEGVTRARRDELLDAIMGPAIRVSACLPPASLVRLRARLMVTSCAELHAGAVAVAEWAQAPARPFLLLVERLGPTIPETCRRVLRRELGDAGEIRLGTPPRPDDAPPDGLGSALVPPPAPAGEAAAPAAPPAAP